MAAPAKSENSAKRRCIDRSLDPPEAVRHPFKVPSHKTLTVDIVSLVSH